jgi:hypothetical protein
LEACLTSRESIKALNSYLKNDSTLHDEIQAHCGRVLGLEDELAIEGDTDRNVDFLDDTNVSYEEVVAEMFGEHAGEQRNVAPSSDGLTSTAEGKDLWAYDPDGNLWLETGELPVTSTD